MARTETRKIKVYNPDAEKIDNVIYPNVFNRNTNKTLESHLKKVINVLKNKNSDDLFRNNTLFVISCLCNEILKIKHENNIDEKIKNFITFLNNNIENPLDEEELSTIINSSLSNKYHFRLHSTLQRFLNLTDKEFAEAGFYEKKNREQAKKERNIAATENIDKKLAELYLAGFSDARIAKELSISKQTSINCRKRLGLTNRNVNYSDIDFYGNMRHLHQKSNKTEKEKGSVLNYEEERAYNEKDHE